MIQWFSATVVNPGAGVVTLDTGPLAAGSYNITWYTMGAEGSSREQQFQHRNAANAATLDLAALRVVASGFYQLTLNEVNVGAGERFRWVQIDAGVGNYTYGICVSKIA